MGETTGSAIFSSADSMSTVVEHDEDSIDLAIDVDSSVMTDPVESVLRVLSSKESKDEGTAPCWSTIDRSGES
jgi:hypothetical protein